MQFCLTCLNSLTTLSHNDNVVWSTPRLRDIPVIMGIYLFIIIIFVCPIINFTSEFGN